jgi:hypothetical protein
MSTAFFSPSHASSCSFSRQAACMAATIAWRPRGSNRVRLSSCWMSVWIKSNSADPDFAWMSRFNVAMDAWLVSISLATMAGSVSIEAGAAPGGIALSPSSGQAGMKSLRSSMVRSASPSSGSDLPATISKPSRVAGEPSCLVTSTNSRPPASAMGRGVVSCHTESPRGLMASVIIC